MKKLIFALMFLGLTQTTLAADFTRKYGEATTVDFKLYKPDGTKLVAGTDAVCANTASANDSDVRVVKDEGAEADLDGTTCFVDEGQGYSVALTATEMTAKRIVLYVVDQTATQTWLDTSIVIETFGNASAQFPDEIVTANLTQIDGQATSGNNATLNLKQLNIINSTGTALVAKSTANGYFGLHAWSTGTGNSHGLFAQSTAGAGVATSGGTYGASLGGSTDGLDITNGLSTAAGTAFSDAIECSGTGGGGSDGGVYPIP